MKMYKKRWFGNIFFFFLVCFATSVLPDNLAESLITLQQKLKMLSKSLDELKKGLVQLSGDIKKEDIQSMMKKLSEASTLAPEVAKTVEKSKKELTEEILDIEKKIDEIKKINPNSLKIRVRNALDKILSKLSTDERAKITDLLASDNKEDPSGSLSKHIDINKRETLIHIITQKSFLDGPINDNYLLLARFKDKKIDPDIKNEKGKTPLDIAVEQGNSYLVKILLDLAKNAGSNNSFYENALKIAINKASQQKQLLAQKDNSNEALIIKMIVDERPEVLLDSAFATNQTSNPLISSLLTPSIEEEREFPSEAEKELNKQREAAAQKAGEEYVKYSKPFYSSWMSEEEIKESKQKKENAREAIVNAIVPDNPKTYFENLIFAIDKDDSMLVENIIKKAPGALGLTDNDNNTVLHKALISQKYDIAYNFFKNHSDEIDFLVRNKNGQDIYLLAKPEVYVGHGSGPRKYKKNYENEKRLAEIRSFSRKKVMDSINDLEAAFPIIEHALEYRENDFVNDVIESQQGVRLVQAFIDDYQKNQHYKQTILYLISKLPNTLTLQNSQGETIFHLMMKQPRLPFIANIGNIIASHGRSIDFSLENNEGLTLLGLVLRQLQGEKPQNVTDKDWKFIVQELSQIRKQIDQAINDQAEQESLSADQQWTTNEFNNALKHFSINLQNQTLNTHTDLDSLLNEKTKNNNSLTRAVLAHSYPEGDFRSVLGVLNEKNSDFGSKILKKYAEITSKEKTWEFISEQNEKAIIIEMMSQEYYDGVLKEAISEYATQKTLFEWRNNNGNSLLHKAVATGNIETTKAILKKAPELINEKNNIGETALDVAENKLKKRVEPSSSNKEDMSLDDFDTAMDFTDENIIQILQERLKLQKELIDLLKEIKHAESDAKLYNLLEKNQDKLKELLNSHLYILGYLASKNMFKSLIFIEEKIREKDVHLLKNFNKSIDSGLIFHISNIDNSRNIGDIAPLLPFIEKYKDLEYLLLAKNNQGETAYDLTKKVMTIQEENVTEIVPGRQQYYGGFDGPYTINKTVYAEVFKEDNNAKDLIINYLANGINKGTIHESYLDHLDEKDKKKILEINNKK